ncbi:metal-dependent transcriptional regulator [Parasphaerochaeta coccoides]|uniref:Iron dependent repressor, N-terminal protein n=1 Tax=Parasphaerochaeta coccoides (strain ATCC BAA-1237 / DSM 17374 / SPN1) TaxID=760011 RepID=F4GIP8_PARC1|nr:MarR family transcriptional regulator [Parasphaerochaeta coccoides]AEC02182.1 Iron dependent repressor, N-terminal protein [Parasphaerochaeta coccoides DSM 17374]
MELSPAKIRYLLSIYELYMEHPESIRPVDVARRLKISRASVTVMLKELEEQNLVSRNTDSGIEFTPKGQKTAMTYYTQYRTFLRFFLQNLQIDGINAREDCISLVSSLSEESLRSLSRYVKDSRLHYILS